MAELLRRWIVDQKALGAVVVTRIALSSPLTLPDIEARLGCPIAGIVAPAAELCAASYRLGAPLALSEPDSVVAANLTDLANRLAGPVLVPFSA